MYFTMADGSPAPPAAKVSLGEGMASTAADQRATIIPTPILAPFRLREDGREPGAPSVLPAATKERRKSRRSRLIWSGGFNPVPRLPKHWQGSVIPRRRPAVRTPANTISMKPEATAAGRVLIPARRLKPTTNSAAMTQHAIASAVVPVTPASAARLNWNDENARIFAIPAAAKTDPRSSLATRCIM